MWAHITRTQMEELVEAVKEDIRQTEALQVELQNKRFEENWWYKRVAYDAFHFWKQHPPSMIPRPCCEGLNSTYRRVIRRAASRNRTASASDSPT